LPLEFAREMEPLSALLGFALETADIETSPGKDGVSARVLAGPKASLVACINETPLPALREVRVDGRWLRVPVAPLRARLVLIEKGGRVSQATPGQPITSR
jgi:hypothetical protein